MKLTYAISLAVAALTFSACSDVAAPAAPLAEPATTIPTATTGVVSPAKKTAPKATKTPAKKAVAKPRTESVKKTQTVKAVETIVS